MIEEIGRFHVEFPVWFLRERGTSVGEGTNAVGIRGETGFLMLPLFTEEELAERFVEHGHLENVVITRVNNPPVFTGLLRQFCKDFASVCFNPPTSQSGDKIRFSLSFEYVLRRMEENQE